MRKRKKNCIAVRAKRHHFSIIRGDLIVFDQLLRWYLKTQADLVDGGVLLDPKSNLFLATIHYRGPPVSPLPPFTLRLSLSRTLFQTSTLSTLFFLESPTGVETEARARTRR